ncbi:hypothetical protein Lbys_2642 [Leadbetterella byssophila DSM 17132]|jgi:hypothetical protein|uniref:Uncharacterized protein n=1 Tax=Leadbetterella byssophila (strain DSM 17132 / JCM 16389 / KACC 11308 / NBRC 106382 / 4M15) TaxID=649349 RepID=E4RZR1_LEAB4|nr:hypothetical protein [Leadbetterella byssophila]ADQ18304.1 hypothetical protein Lbys_2642 [Leadbetterella byssophila DSM 17132]
MVKLFSLFLFLSTAALAQERSIYGRVVDSTKHEGINNLIIQNTRSGQMVNTNRSGDFFIRASAGDSIVVMDIGYNRVGCVYDGQNRYPVIATKTQPIMLREVVITEKRKKELQDEIDAFLENPQSAGAIRNEILGNVLSTETTQPGIGISIDALWELWSKEGKMNRKVADLKYHDLKAFYASLKYNKQVVLQVTKMEEDELDDFMSFCKPTEDFILRANDYDLTQKILQCYREFKTSRIFRKIR